MDLTGTLLYFGSPSAHEQIAADLGLDAYRLELTLSKEILWESETATDAEVRAMEVGPELDGLTQSRWPGEVKSMARSYIAVSTGAPIRDVAVRVVKRSKHSS
jgi:hypothetical protein